MTQPLSHFDESGASRMVDVGAKSITARLARAQVLVVMQPETARLIQDRQLAKGDVLEVARLAGIMATKRTDELIPLCHSLGLDGVHIDFAWPDARTLRVEVVVKTQGRTGVEMEALVGASVTALTVYDMCKAVDRSMCITNLCLLEKSGGHSGTYLRAADL